MGLRRFAFNPHPLALLAACFAIGIGASDWLSMRVALSLGPLAVICALVALKREREGIATLCVAVAYLTAGVVAWQIEEGRSNSSSLRSLYETRRIESGEPVELTGTLARAPERTLDGVYLFIETSRLRYRGDDFAARGQAQLFLPLRDREAEHKYRELKLEYGTRVRVFVRLEREESFRNPGVESPLAVMQQRGIDAWGTIKSVLLIERVSDGERSLFWWLAQARAEVAEKIDGLFAAETAGLLKAILLGNRYAISRAIGESFREGGTFHILVISGTHIAFLGSLILLILRSLVCNRVAQYVVTVLCLWGYALAVGAEAPVARAALMWTCVSFAPIVGRSAPSLNALGGSALALLIWRPQELFDRSFHLTFLSVLAIVALAWPIGKRMREVGQWRPTRLTPHPPRCARWFRVLSEILFWSEREWRRELTRSLYSYRLFKTRAARVIERWHLQRALRYVAVALIISCATQLALLPLFVLYFHRVSLAGILLNIVIAPLVGALAILASFALLLDAANAHLAERVASACEALVALTAHAVDPFAKLGLGALRLPEYVGSGAMIYLIYYAIFIALLGSVARWDPLRFDSRSAEGRWVGLSLAALSLCVAIVIAHPWSERGEGGWLRVDFLDVGQGDAALITLPSGKTVLVDGGGRPRYDLKEAEDEQIFERDMRSIGEAVVAEYLWWRGLDHVDYLVATHADADHIGGLIDIARLFRVRAAFVASTEGEENGEFARFVAALRARGIPLYRLSRGDLLRDGAVAIETLWPPSEGMELQDNERSIVLRVRYGERCLLFTGDIESGVEERLVKSADLRCDVVKVAHHGSRTSSSPDFVSAARPSLAVISVGRRSPFGHPHAEVVARWRASGARVLITGEVGMVTVLTDGRALDVKTAMR